MVLFDLRTTKRFPREREMSLAVKDVLVYWLHNHSLLTHFTHLEASDTTMASAVGKVECSSLDSWLRTVQAITTNESITMLQSIEKENEDLKVRMETMESALKVNAESLGSMAQERNEEKRKTQDTEKSLKSLVDENTSLSKLIKSTNDEVIQKDSQAAKNAQDLTDLQVKLKDGVNQAKELYNQISGAKKKLEIADAERLNLEKQLHTSQQALHSATAKLTELDAFSVRLDKSPTELM
jgi:chromosome segregation ATPase